MNRIRRGLALAVLPLLLATLATAQGLPTGTLSGRVAEPDGLALPGVTITAKSPSLQGTRTAVTNVNGDYVIPNLPPGEYLVTFVMSGFQNVTRNVKVSSGQQVPLNATLSLSAVAAETTVVATSETVSQTAQAATTLSFDTTSKLPVARNLLASVVLSAGVNANGPNAAVTISGAQSYDNVMTINGVNVQDNLRGTPNNLFIEDAIQETTTMTSGVSAEFGRFTGGVVNAVTKQGGNVLSGSFRVNLNNDDWQSQPPIPVTFTDKVVPTYEATIGGPIVKDRVWFFAAGRFNENEFAGQTSAPTNISFPRVNTDKRYEGKLTLTPFQNHTVTGSYTNATVDQDGYYFTNLPILETSILHSRQLPNDLLSVNYNGVLSSNLFVEAQYSRKQFTFENSGSRVNDLIGGTAVLVQDQGFGQMYSPIFCAVCPGSGEERNNDDYLIKGTWFLSTKSLGSHNVVLGFDDFGAQRKSNNWQSGSSWLLYPTSVRYEGGVLYPVVDSSSYLVYAPIPEISRGSDIRTLSLFVNDTWRLNDRLSFNVGLRWDKNDATDASGATTAKDSALSPRLAAGWDVRADGRLRLSASYARYVGQVQENLAGSGATGAGAPASYYYFWTGAPINAGAGPLLATDEVLRQMYGALGVTGLNQFPNVPADTATVPGVNLLIRDSLQSPYADEFVLGAGGTLGANLVYRVDGIYRKFTNFYSTRRDMTTDQVEDALGNVYDLGLYENAKEPEREYA
ncbi:MAG: TonB-dependent receptor, partial [Thermoanaerobaculia bacterium]|nr:TonB-dependent receptor [Thermoanaerobaculia bacterium]